MKIKNILSLVFAAAVLSLLSTFSVFAQGEIDLSSPSSAAAGEVFDVQLSFNADEAIGHIQTSLMYDSDKIEFVSCQWGDGGGGVVTINSFPDSQQSYLYVLVTFKALSDGQAQLYTDNTYLYSTDENLLAAPESAYASITVSGDSDTSAEQTTVTQAQTDFAENESSDTAVQTSTAAQQSQDTGIPSQGVLTSLTVDHGTLTPDFAYNVYSYTVNVDNSVENVEIEGKTASTSDYIWYTGTSACSVGSNIRTITVTAQDGTQVTYTIEIIRAAADGDEAADTAYSQSEQAADDSQKASSEGSSDSTSSTDAMEKYKQILNPALAIVLAVLVIALFVIIVWTRSKLKDMKKK